MEWFKNNENFLPEYWFHLRPTTPLRKPKILIEAFNTIVNDENATSLRSAHLVPESPFKWFMKDDNGYFKGLRPDLTSEKVNMPRQYFPKTYNPNGYVDIIRSSYVLNNVDLHGDKMIVYETPVCPEIDTIKDFDYIKYSIQQNRPEILDWLNNHF
jgi:N-acylneuraminate cytidylyltransferase